MTTGLDPNANKARFEFRHVFRPLNEDIASSSKPSARVTTLSADSLEERTNQSSIGVLSRQSSLETVDPDQTPPPPLRLQDSSRVYESFGSLLRFFDDASGLKSHFLKALAGKKGPDLDKIELLIQALSPEKQAELQEIVQGFHPSMNELPMHLRAKHAEALLRRADESHQEGRCSNPATILGYISLGIGCLGGISSATLAIINMCYAQDPLTTLTILNAWGVPADPVSCSTCLGASASGSTYVGCILGLLAFASCMQNPDARATLQRWADNGIQRSEGFFRNISRTLSRSIVRSQEGHPSITIEMESARRRVSESQLPMEK